MTTRYIITEYQTAELTNGQLRYKTNCPICDYENHHDELGPPPINWREDCRGNGCGCSYIVKPTKKITEVVDPEPSEPLRQQRVQCLSCDL